MNTPKNAVPEAALAAADHMLGDMHAGLTLVEYGDYECPACIRAEPLTQQLIETFGKRLRFIFRHFPLVTLRLQAELAAEAAEAAAAQGKFWAMHHRLFSPPHQLTRAVLATHAQAIGLDMNRFNAEMADRIYTQRIQAHRRAGEHSGVRTTPTFLLNGTAVDVSLGFDKLDEAIACALQPAPPAAVRRPR